MQACGTLQGYYLLGSRGGVEQGSQVALYQQKTMGWALQSPGIYLSKCIPVVSFETHMREILKPVNAKP